MKKIQKSNLDALHKIFDSIDVGSFMVGVIYEDGSGAFFSSSQPQEKAYMLAMGQHNLNHNLIESFDHKESKKKQAAFRKTKRKKKVK